VARHRGTIPAWYLTDSRPLDCSEVEHVLGREIEWLPDLAPEPTLRWIGREAAAIVVALGLWAVLSLAIIVFVWRVEPDWTGWLIVLVPVYLPAPLAAFVYVLLAHPKTQRKSVKRAVILAALGWVLSYPIPVQWLPTPTIRAIFFFHPIPVGMEDALGVYVTFLISFWPIGIPFCLVAGWAAGRFADAVLEKRAAHLPTR
jgi:hypothetical protein